jgi:hypothetical protein
VVFKVRQHGLQNHRIDLGGGGIVKINFHNWSSIWCNRIVSGLDDLLNVPDYFVG